MLPWLLRHALVDLGGGVWGRSVALPLFAGPLFIARGESGYAYAPLAHGAVIQPAALTLGAMAAPRPIFGEGRSGRARSAWPSSLADWS